jgi:hypothetical protein
MLKSTQLIRLATLPACADVEFLARNDRVREFPEVRQLNAAATMSWESQLAALLQRLSTAQRELLSLLATKRKLIVERNHQALASLAAREQQLGEELQACHAERERMLAAADAEGLPHDSLAELSDALPGAAARRLGDSVAEARKQAHLIRHECLTQWVAVQRTVLHLSQLLEIIATGGRQQPTYGKDRAVQRGGALIDQAV